MKVISFRIPEKEYELLKRLFPGCKTKQEMMLKVIRKARGKVFTEELKNKAKK